MILTPVLLLCLALRTQLCVALGDDPSVRSPGRANPFNTPRRHTIFDHNSRNRIDLTMSVEIADSNTNLPTPTHHQSHSPTTGTGLTPGLSTLVLSHLRDAYAQTDADHGGSPSTTSFPLNTPNGAFRCWITYTPMSVSYSEAPGMHTSPASLAAEPLTPPPAPTRYSQCHGAGGQGFH